MIDFSIRLKDRKHSHWIEIRSRDSIIIPLMIAENRIWLFHYESLLSKVYRRDTRDSSSYVGSISSPQSRNSSGTAKDVIFLKDVFTHNETSMIGK